MTEPGYLYVDAGAPGARTLLDCVTVSAGALSLAPVPAAPTTVSANLEWLAGVAGLAVDRYGRLYVAEPARHRVVRIECDDSVTVLRCPDLDTPRGVGVGRRDELLVADTGHDRVLALDEETLQVAGSWDTPTAPFDLAVDSAGRIYVACQGSPALSRLGDPSFAARIARGRPRVHHVLGVAVTEAADGERLLVLDRMRGRTRVLVFDLEGRIDRDATDALTAAAEDVPEAAAIAASPDAVYVGDPAHGRVLVFDAHGAFRGAVRDYNGPTAGLAIDAAGRLVVNPGGGSIVRLAGTSVGATGSFRIGPLTLTGDVAAPTAWQLLRAAVDLPAGAHIRLYALTTPSPDADPPPLPPADVPATTGSVAQGSWQVGPADAVELLLAVEPGAYLWVGGRLLAGDAGGPTVRVLRVEHDEPGWIRNLPAVYARDDATRPFLDALLRLLQSALASREQLIDDMPELLDPAASPEQAWLDWLSGWLAFRLDRTWPDPRRREAVARAWALNASRGTAEGLLELVRLSLGVDAWISEPGVAESPWLLDGSAPLGFATTLVAAEAQGAVIGTTAELGMSNVLDAADIGAPVFAPLANRFCVGAFASQLGGGGRAALEAIVEREKPAHTAAHVCVVEPRARVGFQARVGIDAVVASGAPQLRLGAVELGEAVLPAARSSRPRVGQARVH